MGDEGRFEEALRAVAHAEASRNFSARVRARIEAGADARAARWPLLAAGCAIVLALAAVTWWPRDAPVSPTNYVAPATAQPVVASSGPLVPRVEPRGESQHAPSRVLEPRVSGASAHVGTAIAAPRDHDLALEPLAALGAITLPSIDPPAVIVADEVVVPLAPVAPLRVHEMPANLEKGAL